MTCYFEILYFPYKFGTDEYVENNIKYRASFV